MPETRLQGQSDFEWRKTDWLLGASARRSVIIGVESETEARPIVDPEPEHAFAKPIARRQCRIEPPNIWVLFQMAQCVLQVRYVQRVVNLTMNTTRTYSGRTRGHQPVRLVSANPQPPDT